MFDMGRPIPILVCGMSVSELSCDIDCRHRVTCSPTVAQIPRRLEIALLRAPNLDFSIRVALRVCEKENRSEGVLIWGVSNPPPALDVLKQCPQLRQSQYLGQKFL